ncbi:MAG: hypothetical protein RMX65_007590 [Nostoc sp. DedQUE01]
MLNYKAIALLYFSRAVYGTVSALIGGNGDRYDFLLNRLRDCIHQKRV